MKSAPFDYHRPDNIDEACAILAGDEDARIIAGGQSLVPMMAMRLVRPTRLVDIGRFGSLSYVRAVGDAVAIGATTRQCVVERDPLVGVYVPLLSKVLPWVGHAATRARGTIGGSIARRSCGQSSSPRSRSANSFIVGWGGQGSRPGSLPVDDDGAAIRLLTTIRPPCIKGKTWALGSSVSARRNDFAFASAAARVALEDDGSCRELAIGIGAITGFRLTSPPFSGQRREAVRRSVTQ